MPALRKQLAAHARQKVVVCLAAISLGVIFWLLRLNSSPDQLGLLDRLSYDLSLRVAPETRISELHIIDMDLKSFQMLQQDTGSTDLWDRRLHAQLLRKLTKDGAKVI